VLASAAVLVAIAVPSASRLGGHARTTLCLSNIRHMATAFLAYAEDYDGVFPFVSTMQESPDPCMTPDPNEIWLADWQGAADPLVAIWDVGYQQEGAWPASPNVPRSGTLFTYAPSASVYRCPEFERVTDPNKAQNVFNYTRAIWGRRWTLAVEGDPNTVPEPWGDVTGPILRVSDIHKPSELPMVLDEQWNRHVATAGALGHNGSAYNCNDHGFSPENVIGVYHGPPLPSKFHGRDYHVHGYYDLFLWKLGGGGYYDGHAGLRRDPWPSFELGNNERWESKEPWRLGSMGARQFDEVWAIMEYMVSLLYAQRGFDPSEQFLDPFVVVPWGLDF